jgi:hypothetical protein
VVIPYGCVDVPKAERRKIPVHLLQVCRQIYNEAVLKPFTQTTFHFTANKTESPGANTFMNNLVPQQVRSITHLCVTSKNGYFLKQPLNFKLKGLKHLEIHMPSFDRYLAQDPVVKELKNLGLHSLRITTFLQWGGDKAHLLEMIRRQESEILSKQQPLLTAG